MEKVNILAIAPYEGLKSVMMKTAQSWEDLSLTVEVGDLEEAIRIVEKMPCEQYDVLVSRGGTARMLKSRVRLPIVEIPVSVYDVLRSLKMAELYAKKVAVVGYSNITECATQLKNMMQYSIDIYTINVSGDLEDLLDGLQSVDYDLLLCDMVSFQAAKRRALNALLITSGEESITAAFEECVRISRAYKTTKVQQDLLRYFLTENCQEALVYSLEGKLEYATMEQSTRNAPIFAALSSRIDVYRSSPIILDQIEAANVHLSLKGQHVQTGGRTYILLHLTFNASSPFQSAEPETALEIDERVNEDLLHMIRTLYSPAILEIIDNYSCCSYPILLAGQGGCGKDIVAKYIYQSDLQHKNAFIVFDCQMLKEKKWNFLFNSSNSALLHSNVTIYFKNINQAQPQQVVKLIDFILQSDFCKYNRIIFSAVTDCGETGGYICDYIKDHCSCCLLMLPSLNENSARIPSILALYINSLNMEMGKQIIGFMPEAMESLQKFHWKDNYSQFFRVVRSLMASGTDAYIGKSAVQLALSMEKDACSDSVDSDECHLDLSQPLEKISYDIVKRVLEEEQDNQSRTAARLGISRTTLWRILKNNS